MKNDNDIKDQDSSNIKLLQLAESWKVEMPPESFFINLPVVVIEKLNAKPVSWWQKGWVYWGALSGAMAAVMLLFAWQLGTGINAGNNLAKAASEWGLDDYGWERMEEVLVQSDQVSGQQNLISASLQTYSSEVLLEYGITDQDDYQTVTTDLSLEEWQDVLEKVSAKERII